MIENELRAPLEIHEFEVSFRKHRAEKLEHIVEYVIVLRKVLTIKLPKGITFRNALEEYLEVF